MIKMQFPNISKELSYLDNAATTQKPVQVIDTIKNYYKTLNANVNRGLYSLAETASRHFGNARKTIGNFVNAERIIFTKNATESINLVAYSLSKLWKENDNVVTTIIEHHSNFVPWQQLAKQKNVEFRVAGIKNQQLDEKELLSLINKKTKIVAINYVSNAIGIKTNLKELIPKIRKKSDAKILVDATQAVPHIEVDMKELGVDFLVFSGHKMYGPTVIGVLALTKKALDELPEFLYGGDMITSVSKEKTEFAHDIRRFEAGTPNISGAIGLASARDFRKRTTFEEIKRQDKKLIEYAKQELNKIEGLKIYGDKQISVLSFTMKQAHPHDIASILDQEGVAVRAGNHCAQPLVEALGINSTVRISFGIYNDKEDIDKLLKGIKKVTEVFK